jgi:hypothetical protein
MNDIDVAFIWAYLVDKGIATNEELVCIARTENNMERLNNLVYARTAYQDVEQLQEEETEEHEKTERCTK